MIQRINDLDLKISQPLNSYFSSHGVFLNTLLAQYLVYILPVVLLVLWFWSEKTKKVALKALFSAILAWPVIAQTMGILINRPRPFEGGVVQELVFHRPTYSFPSDHAAALFAITVSLWLSGYKKLAYWMLVLSIVISFFRVATGVHWPTDIIGGAIVGILSAWLVDLFDKPLTIVYNFLIKIAKTLRLA